MDGPDSNQFNSILRIKYNIDLRIHLQKPAVGCLRWNAQVEHSVSMTFYCVTVKVTVKMDQMKMGIFAEVRHFIIPNER